MENLALQIRKAAINSGLLFGTIYLVLKVFMFYLITGMTNSFWLIVFSPVIFSIIVPLLITIFFALDLRKKIGGYWNFKNATTGIFILLFTSFILNTVLYDVVFAKVVEPNLIQKTEDAMINATRSFMEKNSTDQKQIDEKVDNVKQQFDSQINLTVGKIIQGYAITIVLLFAYAMILGVIFKRTPLRSLDEVTDPAV